MDQEDRMNELIRSLGLSGWSVLWEPDSTQPKRGRIIPETRIILVHDKEPEAAMETLLHEALEIKLRPMLNPYRTLVNSLIEWADSQVYREKEKVIEDILQLVKFDEKEKNLKGVSLEK